MGFLDGLRKMMQGKPVFEDPAKISDGLQDASRAESAVTPLQSVEPEPPQEKMIPTFDLRHCQTSTDGDNMTVTIWATNTSPLDIEIDKCVILDTKTEVDRRLGPGQAHEIILYKGQIPKTDHAHQANIFYKSVRENEYFRVDFMVEYTRQSDGRYTVEDLHPERHAIKELSSLL